MLPWSSAGYPRIIEWKWWKGVDVERELFNCRESFILIVPTSAHVHSMASLAVGGGEAVDYYSDKLNAADVGSCFQVVKTKSKGKIIVATSDISKGVLIHRESPLVAMQSLDNKFDVEKYSNFLRKNNIKTSDFEDDIKKQLTRELFLKVFEPLSWFDLRKFV